MVAGRLLLILTSLSAEKSPANSDAVDYKSICIFGVINIFDIEDYCSLEHTACREYLLSFSQPWLALRELKDYIRALGETLSKQEYDRYGRDVWIHKNTVVYPTAFVKGPCIIGRGSEVRHSAFIRGSALIGENCVVGNSTEIKNSILFDSAQVPHFNYVGDSILGYKAHLGAGAVTSNVKSDKSEVFLSCGTEKIPTGLRKFGALIGDRAEIGCGSVLCPGTVIGRNTTVYPLVRLRGTVDSDSIVKAESITVRKV